MWVEKRCYCCKFYMLTQYILELLQTPSFVRTEGRAGVLHAAEFDRYEDNQIIKQDMHVDVSEYKAPAVAFWSTKKTPPLPRRAGVLRSLIHRRKIK